MSEAREARIRQTFDHMQRIHGFAPSDLPIGLDIGDEHSADHETGCFDHNVTDLFTHVDEEGEHR